MPFIADEGPNGRMKFLEESYCSRVANKTVAAKKIPAILFLCAIYAR